MKLSIILLAMAAAAAGALHSWHERSLYVRAALLSEAFGLTAPVKLRVADHYLRHAVMPHDNADAGLPPPRSLYGTSVKRVAINRGGVLIVDFEEEIGRRSMTFTPSADPLGGKLDWHCTSDSIEAAVLERLRPACAYLPATPESRLMSAIANADLGRVEALLAEGARPEAVVRGNTPLMLAAKVGDTAIVERLLDAGAAVDHAALNLERRTPLMVAITSDRAEVAALLLSRGASATVLDHRGRSALDHANETDRRLGGQRYGLMVGARLNPRFAGLVPTLAEERDVADRATLAAALYEELRDAARLCHVQRLESLLRENDDLALPELVDGLPLASRTRRPGCRDALLAHLESKESFRRARSARFGQAVASCDMARVDAMLGEQDGLDVLSAEGGARSPFERALLAGCSEAASLMVRERGLTGRLDDDMLELAIREAPQGTLVSLVGTLIAADVDVDARGSDGQTPLALAIALEQPVVAKYLVDAGADVNAPTANGSWPIIEATKRGYAHLVTELIERGAAVDNRDALGRTALLAAVAGGRQRLVDALVRAGADVRRRDANGIDAVLLAESRDLRRIRRLLVASGEP